MKGRDLGGRIAVCVLGVFIVLALPSAAAAATRYAAPAGVGPEPCAQASPCDVHTAVEAAPSGDEVVLLPGNYAIGSDTLNIPSNVVVRGQAGPERPVITPTSASWTVFGSADTTLRDVDIVVPATGLYGVVFVTIVDGVRSHALGPGDTACVPEPGGSFRNSTCVASGAGGHAVSILASCGGPVVAVTAPVRNVTAIASGTNGAALDVSTNGGCNYTIAGRNVIAEGAGADLRVTSDGAPGNHAEIDLNRSAFDDPPEINGGGAVASAVGSGSNLNATASFRDAGLLDFRQIRSSPTVDAGSNAAAAGDFDFEGDPRIIAGRVDIGADEFTPRCGGRRVTVFAQPGATARGTGGADVILGTFRRDTIQARGGNDRVCALNGNDRLNGGGNRDRLLGQGGRDRLVGGPGRGDFCHGGPARDRAARSCERQRSIP